MTETPLMNDDAARSTTGEILDQSQTSTTGATSTETSSQSTSPDKATQSADGTTTQTTEVKPEAKTEAKPEGAPAAYTDFKAPDGYTLSPDTIAAATPIFKELGLNQDQAQKLVDFHAKAMVDAAKAPNEAYTALRTDWQTKTKSDYPGPALETAKTEIGRMLTALPADVTSAFREAMDLTGAGDHPAVFKALHKLAAFVTEGKHVSGAGPSSAGQKAPGSAPPTAAAALYPNLPRAS